MSDSFEQFVRGHTPHLLRAAYLLTGDQHSAEDLVQAALERTAAWWRVRSPAGGQAYARRVMYRLQVSRWRTRRLGERLNADPPETAGPDPYSAVDPRLGLQQALSVLTPRQRAVLVLSFYDDLSVEHTADVLGCSGGTVTSHTNLAVRRLRDTAPDLAALVDGEVSDRGHHPLGDALRHVAEQATPVDLVERVRRGTRRTRTRHAAVAPAQCLPSLPRRSSGGLLPGPLGRLRQVARRRAGRR